MPLFLLMGNVIVQSGVADEIYDAAYAWLRHRKGGLAMATIAACGGFSSVCGSSLATAATMGRIALPAMRRHGYSDSLATGSIAAGGTLGTVDLDVGLVGQPVLVNPRQVRHDLDCG